MKCPFCGFYDSEVLDSRASDANNVIRRRRCCKKCKERFTTYERVELPSVTVVKKDGSKQPFSEEKLLRGLMRSCEKRPVQQQLLKQLVEQVHAILANQKGSEVTTAEVGELVMEKLRAIDDVAYVRFASVYYRFDDIQSFLDVLKNMEQTV